MGFGGRGEAEGKKLLGRRRCKWESIIKMGLQEIVWRGAWTGLIWLGIWRRWPAFVKAMKNRRVLLNAWDFFASWTVVRFSRKTLFYGVSYHSVIILH